MDTSITFINHASVVITGNGISLLSDPWYKGSAFHKGWDLLQETSDINVKKILKNITYIWISHEHPDHFSIIFFKSFAEIIKKLKIKILFQETEDKRVLSFLKYLGLECQELKFDKRTYLNDKFSVMCIKDGFYDSGLLVQNNNEKILNLNDCEITTKQRAQEVFSKTGKIDALLTQFSFAAWKGGKKNKKWRDEAAKEKLNTIRLQVNKFMPRYVIPFASYIYFSNEENSYLNDAVNKPDVLLKEFPSWASKIIIMKPFDQLGGKNEKVNIKNAIIYWNKQYSKIKNKKLNNFIKINTQELFNNFKNYCDRISRKNRIWFMKFLRIVLPISVFKPVTIQLIDLECIVKFDYINRDINIVKEKPLLKMKSESLNFLFLNSFGFDTLTVNGCFEEGQKGGFVMATKTLAIENLNNLGINFTPLILLNIRLIKLFLIRLYRVARKLE
jgi:hypothetical protein